MIYEGTIKYETITSNGNTKIVKERYLVEDAETFSEAESMLFKMGETSSLSDFDVTALKRSKIKEIANRNRDTEPMFIATLVDTFTDDNGNEKELTYDIAFFSTNIESAHDFIKQYSQQGYCMEMKALKQAKFIDVVKYGSTESLHRD